MAKLIVEVLDARDLLPTNDHGSASPFVEVDFDGRRQRTQTKTRDLYPSWNEKLVFDIKNPRNLHISIIQVTLYDDRCANRHKEFLGCVQISGASVSLLESEAAVQRYPLCKRGFFSHGRGDISLRIYAVRAQYYGNQQRRHRLKSKKTPKLQEISEDDDKKHNGGDKSREEDNETRNFYSAGTSGGAVPASKVEIGSNSVDDEIADVIHLEKLLPDHLFVKVVKARDLPVTDTTGNLGLYVEVKFRKYKGVTKHIANNESPVWDEVFAFYDEGLDRSLVVVVVKDFGTDEFVGSIVVIDSVPVQLPADSPLTPQWYELENREGDKMRGEIMLAVWMGTQADDAFPGAWHSDSHRISAHQNLTYTRSGVHFCPTLYYLRIRVIEAQDLATFNKNQPPEFRVRLKLGDQVNATTISRVSDGNPVWNEDVMFVASEPLDDFLIINIIKRISPWKDELIGRTVLPLSGIPQRFDSTEPLQARWFNLNSIQEGGKKKKKQGKIFIRFCLEAGYHVSDSSHGDFQPSAKHMKKDSIGSLELTILSARSLPPMKQRDGGTTDAYCVAKYGNKWVRTRTVMNSQEPCWNEQYAWEVYDPCTIITIGIFDNCSVNGSKKRTKDMRIGKVCIQLQTLEVNRIHTHYYPLLVLLPSGLKHCGLQVAVQFTGVAWANMVAQYTKPVLPKMHYLEPFEVRTLDVLRHMAWQIVAACLSEAEPPIKKEIVGYMLDVEPRMWSMRRQKAYFDSLMSYVLGVTAVCRWFDEIRHWRNPLKTIFIYLLYLVFVWYPKLILPTFFLLLSMMGLWNYRFRPRNPPHLDAHLSQAEATDPDHLDEEFDTFPTTRPVYIVKIRYDRLRSIAGRYQTVARDIATQGERAVAILTCTDLRATSIFTVIAFVWVVVIYMASFRVVATLLGLYWLRHPRFRSKRPSLLVNLFKRLPSKMDVFL